jgi:hypothetical protein
MLTRYVAFMHLSVSKRSLSSRSRAHPVKSNGRSSSLFIVHLLRTCFQRAPASKMTYLGRGGIPFVVTPIHISDRCAHELANG